jgi:hypothetical protein
MTISAAYGYCRGLALLASLSLALLAAPAAHAECHCSNGCAVDSSWLGGAYTGPITFYGTAACAAANGLPAANEMELTAGGRLLLKKKRASAIPALRSAHIEPWPQEAAALLTGVAAAGAADFVNAQAFYTVRDIRTASAALPEGVSEALFIDTGDMSAGAWTRRP